MDQDNTRYLQKVILMIIKDIDSFCKDNGIEYYLLGGSAIGAIRHKGFIPWDDDLDIIMTHENYDKFVECCKGQLDKEKYDIQLGREDWPLYFSKIRLKGTELKEHCDGYDYKNKGIYVDVFMMDNVPDSQILALWQYFCAKLYLCYQLSKRKYTVASVGKKVLMFLSFPLKLTIIRDFIIRQVEKYNDRPTRRLGFYYGRTNRKTSQIDKALFGKPLYVPFEDTMLPVPEFYHEYLTQMFGDYMKLPPLEERVGLHITNINFGKY